MKFKKLIAIVLAVTSMLSVSALAVSAAPSTSIICENGSSPEVEQYRPSTVRYSSEMVKMPLKISLLPTIFVSVNVLCITCAE